MLKRRAGFGDLLALALDGLLRKPGRNVLTATGVFIGVFALTLIVSLGQGIAGVLSGSISGEDNLRQIGVTPGFGNTIVDDADAVVIEHEPDQARAARLRRAALARAKPGPRVGRRPMVVDDKLVEEIRALPHVTEVRAIVSDRYALTAGDLGAEATLTLGVDAAGGQYRDRVIAGSYFSAPDANEVILHEYLAYQWGFHTVEQARALVGRRVTLTMLGNQDPVRDMAEGFMARLDLSKLSQEDAADLMKVPAILSRIAPESRKAVSREFIICGIGRDMEKGDKFNVILDGNAFQVDVFLPQGVAMDLFKSSSINEELGYNRLLVVVDEVKNAGEVEKVLREKGFQAFSVASIVERLDSTLQAITIIITFLTGIALLVAALGIVNTMVTSVIERTREIGLWKALGATNRQVWLVFVLESSLIGLIGGLLGLGIAWAAMFPAEAIAQERINREALVPFAQNVFVLPVWLAVLGPVVATLVAMLAAMYPALRAARTDPVRALRHD